MIPRCLSPPSSPPRIMLTNAGSPPRLGSNAMSSSRPQKGRAGYSKVLSALDAEMNLMPEALGDLRLTEKEGTTTEFLKRRSTELRVSVPKTAVVPTKQKPFHPLFVTTTLDLDRDPVPTTITRTSKATTKAIKSAAKRKNAIAGSSAPQRLPVYTYKSYVPVPARVYTRDESEANDLVQLLKGPLGFDMEWCVLFWRGAKEKRTALVQLCDENMILLVQVSAMKRFPQKVKEIIESPDIVKLGANIRNDGQKLFRDFGILARNLVELGGVARAADPAFPHKRSIVSLAQMVELYTGRTLVKGKERTGDWEAVLNEAQMDYAANDAHCAVMAHKAIIAIAQNCGRTLVPSDYTADLARDYDSGKLSLASSMSTTTTGSSTPTTSSSDDGVGAPSPQHLRAYMLWHGRGMRLEDMCRVLSTRGREEPLKEGTVITYVVRALQADSNLAFDMGKLKELVQLDAGSWTRHGEWIVQRDGVVRRRAVGNGI